MNEKEAKEVMEDILSYPSLKETAKFHYCKGYLDAIGKAKGVEKSLKSVIDWFELLKKDQHEKLVENQSFESACENWHKLEHQTFDMEPLIKEMEKWEKTK